MPSLDGYSLNEKIDKLRDDVYSELLNMRESFRELYQYLDNIEKKEKACQAKESAAKSKTPKKDKSASNTKASIAKA